MLAVNHHALLLETNVSQERNIEIFNEPDLTDEELEAFLAAYAELESLDIKNCPQLGDKALQFLASRFPFLKRLSWIGCSAATEEGYQFFLEKNRSLVSLNLSGATHFSSPLASYLLSNFPSLQFLDLSFCPIDDEAFASVQSPLVFLNLQGCKEIGDKTIDQIAKIPTLRHLLLAFNEKISPEALRSLQKLPLKTLKI